MTLQPDTFQSETFQADQPVNGSRNANVNSVLRLLGRPFAIVAALGAVVVGSLALAPLAAAQSPDALDVLRVELPLEKRAYKDSELRLDDIINNNTYIEVDEFNLRAVEIEASTEREGEIRLKVGRYVTPPVPLPGPQEEGLLRIEAPHKGNAKWRLLIDDRVEIASLTAVLEPRGNNVSYYQERYEPRGYAFGNDPYYRQNRRYNSRQGSWPYSWLGNDYDYNRQAGHWLWLTDRRTRFHLNLNPSYGSYHRHTRDCYDGFGRHRGFSRDLRQPQRYLERQRATIGRGNIGSRSSRQDQHRSGIEASREQQKAIARQQQQQAIARQQLRREQQQRYQREQARARERDTFRRTERARSQQRQRADTMRSRMGNRSRTGNRDDGGRRSPD